MENLKDIISLIGSNAIKVDTEKIPNFNKKSIALTEDNKGESYESLLKEVRKYTNYINDPSSVYDLANPLMEGYGLDTVNSIDFYRDIFPEGELQKKGEINGNHKYNGIAVEILPNKKSKRYTITDDLDIITDLASSENFVIVSPISYIGKARNTKNARCLYALCVEIDNLRHEKFVQSGLRDLLFQMDNKVLPKPKYIVCSGHGLHLYYKFDKPILLFKDTIKHLQSYKKWLTRKLWNKYVTFSYDEKQVQYESLFQGFRMVGGVTKKGERTMCFKLGEDVTIDYMNSFLPSQALSKSKSDIEEWEGLFIPKSYKYDSKYKLSDAKEKFPSWYERKIVNKEEKSHWTNKKDLYNWWLNEIKNKGTEGHRYYCLMILVIYALKCGVDEEELRKDCNSFLEPFEKLTKEGSRNHFTQKDVDDAIKCYQNKELVTYPLNSIINRSGIAIKKNKRNGRKQKDHIKIMNYIRDEVNRNINWREGNGRKPKKDLIYEWRNNNPDGTKYRCMKELKLSKNTIKKWWDYQN